MQYLFVYGTLRPGYPNEHIMNNIGGEWKEATIKGRYIEEGWGFDNHGLPGLVVDNEGQQISGFIFMSKNLNNHWVFLDDFEGSDYARAETNALCSNGDVKKVHVYALKRRSSDKVN